MSESLIGFRPHRNLEIWHYGSRISPRQIIVAAFWETYETKSLGATLVVKEKSFGQRNTTSVKRNDLDALAYARYSVNP